MNEINFSKGLLSAMKIARNMANQEKHSTYGVPHLVMAMLIEPTGLREILESMGKDVAYILEWFEVRKETYQSDDTVDDNCFQDSEVQKVLEEAERSKIKLGTDFIDVICVFTAVVREGVVYSVQQLDSLELKEQDILNQYNVPRISINSDPEQEAKIISSSFCVNLKTEKNVAEGELIIGREKEVRALLENLERTENKATLLVGDSGIGKTAIIKAFVKELSEDKDDQVQGTLVFGLNVSKLLASCNSEAEISKKLVELFEKLNKLDDSNVLVIDDLQVLLDSATGKSNTIINILNAQLNEGTSNLIFSISSDAYRKNLEKHSINSKLEILFLEELDTFLLLKCLDKHKERFEKEYKINISADTLSEAIHLSQRYFKESKLPYGAIDLLDRTLASVKMSNDNSLKKIKAFEEQLEEIKKSEEKDISEVKLLSKTIFKKISVILISKVSGKFELKEDDSIDKAIEKIENLLNELKEIATNPIKEIQPTEVESIIADITGIPIGKIQADEKDKLLKIEEKLNERVKGQNSAIQTLADAIIESRSGLSNPKQPIGSFFFLGPTGTGKTELTKSLAELLFDDESAMIRFDMSEFKEEHSAALLYGAPPGYVGYEEGGMLVNKIRQKPYSVVLFDEIEKAHSSVYDVFLQIMDEGTIHDKLGRSGDFSNSIIIFTSNIGSQWIAEQIEKGEIPTSNQLIEVMSKYFRPEFLGRLTEVVPFSPINEQIAKAIFELHFSRLQNQLLQQKNIQLSLSQEALDYLAKKGYSKKYGARPIAGVIRNYIKKVISKFIVSEQIKNGDKVLLTYKDNDLVWEQVN